MTHRFIRSFLIAGAGALLIGMMSLAPARAQDYPNTPHQGKGRWQGTHAKRPPASVWGRTPGTRQTHRKDSLWGNETRGAQPPSPWGEKRSAKGLNSNPPSPWTPSRAVSHRNFAGDAAAGKGRRQAFRYGSHPTHIGKWTSTRSHNAPRGEHYSPRGRRWTQRAAPGAWKLKQKAAPLNGKRKNASQTPIQTGLPQK